MTVLGCGLNPKLFWAYDTDLTELFAPFPYAKGRAFLLSVDGAITTGKRGFAHCFGAGGVGVAG